MIEGDIILYRMKLADWPVDPQREWRGRVKEVNLPTDRTSEYYRIVSLEPEYEGLEEIVHPFQVVKLIEKETQHVSTPTDSSSGTTEQG